VVPDGDRPLFHVTAEAPTEAAARKLAQTYIEMIRSWQEQE
jgi:phosphomannomutase